MSKRVKGSLPHLQVIAKCKPKLRKLLIEHCPADVITAICECSLNLLRYGRDKIPCSNSVDCIGMDLDWKEHFSIFYTTFQYRGTVESIYT